MRTLGLYSSMRACASAHSFIQWREASKFWINLTTRKVQRKTLTRIKGMEDSAKREKQERVDVAIFRDKNVIQ